MKKEVQLAGK